MTIWVVRHGSAGCKEHRRGDDGRRPLDALGRGQAKAIADLLAPRRPLRLLSSPADRCVQTLLPLAGRRELDVVATAALAVDDQPSDGLVGFLQRDARPGDVLCTHGEVLHPALQVMRRCPGLVPDGDDDAMLAKGGIWEVDVLTPSLTLLRPGPHH